MMKFEMHVHTAENDLYAHACGADLARLYQEKGYRGIVVTDHYFSMFFDEWFGKELKNATHEQKIDRWLKGYRAVREAGERRGLTVLPGAEVRFDGNPNDYLVYGVDEAFFYRTPLLYTLKGVEELQSYLPAAACVVQAHPFRDYMVVRDPKPLFGIEVYNGQTDAFRNELAKTYAEHYGKPVTSGSDTHAPAHVGRGGLIFEDEIRTPADLARALRSGKYTLI